MTRGADESVAWDQQQHTCHLRLRIGCMKGPTQSSAIHSISNGASHISERCGRHDVQCRAVLDLEAIACAASFVTSFKLGEAEASKDGEHQL